MQSQQVVQCYSPSYRPLTYRLSRPQSPTINGTFQSQIHWESEVSPHDKLFYLGNFYSWINSSSEEKQIPYHIEKMEIEDDRQDNQEILNNNSSESNSIVEENHSEIQYDEQIAIEQEPTEQVCPVYEKNIVKNAVHSCCRYFIDQRNDQVNSIVKRKCQITGVSLESFIGILRDLLATPFPSMSLMKNIYLNPTQQDPIYDVKLIFRQYFDHFINNLYEREIRKSSRIKSKQRYYDYCRRYLCYLIQPSGQQGNYE